MVSKEEEKREKLFFHEEKGDEREEEIDENLYEVEMETDGLLLADCQAEEVHAVAEHYKCDISTGYDEKRVARQFQIWGPNELEEAPRPSVFAMILAQFEDLLVKILLLAAFVSFLLAYFEGTEQSFVNYVEPFVILLILVCNAVVGVLQEHNAESALDALKSLQPSHAQVLRQGRLREVPSRDLVPGDVVRVSPGDRVPADLRICEITTGCLQIDQSTLTGEAEPCQKDLKLCARDAELHEKSNLLFASTNVFSGTCFGICTHTGMKTEIGKIQSAVRRAFADEEKTPLQIKLEEFGEQLAKVIFAICLIVWLINYHHFFDPVHGGVLKGSVYYFKIAVALAVAAIPEGLPAVITTSLALGTRRMARRKAIVRKLVSVQTLGCTNMICSDKTGTLTTNEMTVVEFSNFEENYLKTRRVDGDSYRPFGKVEDFQNLHTSKGLQEFAAAMSVCNESELVYENGKYTRLGQPTEVAMKVLVEKLGSVDDLDLNSKFLNHERDERTVQIFNDLHSRRYKKLATLEFSRTRKSMSVVCRDPEGQNILFCKGAAEQLLQRCDKILKDDEIVEMTSSEKSLLEAKIEQSCSRALRTLLICARHDIPTDFETYLKPEKYEILESELIFLGLVSIRDPPRRECREAIAAAKRAGISILMITGDNQLTAEAIAHDLQIIDGHEEDLRDSSICGRDFELLSEEEQKTFLLRATRTGLVFSRTEPCHKQTVVRLLRELGFVTAMTGDGVNDAPALKQADIGISMGLCGSEVAKEASDMILADDNFSTIVAAVEEGRSIYNNMKAFIRYLISSNIGEVASIFLTAALGIPEALVPVQLLWVNLVTDGLPATALSFNPPDLDVMDKPPRNKNDPLISSWTFFRYLCIGFYVGFATVGIFIYWFCWDSRNPDGHSLVDFSQLSNFGQCREWQNFDVKRVGFSSSDPCDYFQEGKKKASSLSLTVLVVIEMLNALNALSENLSLWTMPPWLNPYLIFAILLSLFIHFLVLYTPFLAQVFNVLPLSLHDWILVMSFSFPVILLDEILKFVRRRKLLKREIKIE